MSKAILRKTVARNASFTLQTVALLLACVCSLLSAKDSVAEPRKCGELVPEILSRIVARGNHFQFFINGKLTSDFTDNAKSGQLDHGAIGLQIHDKGMHVEFKDLRLKQLPSALQPEEPVPVGLQKQLLVDDYVIAEKQNVTRELGKVKKHGIVVEPSLPTDFIPPRSEREGGYKRNLKSGKKPDGSRVALDLASTRPCCGTKKTRSSRCGTCPGGWRA